MFVIGEDNFFKENAKRLLTFTTCASQLGLNLGSLARLMLTSTTSIALLLQQPPTLTKCHMITVARKTLTRVASGTHRMFPLKPHVTINFYYDDALFHSGFLTAPAENPFGEFGVRAATPMLVRRKFRKHTYEGESEICCSR